MNAKCLPLQRVPNCGRSHKIKPVYIYGSVLDGKRSERARVRLAVSEGKICTSVRSAASEFARPKFERQWGSAVTNVSAGEN